MQKYFISTEKILVELIERSNPTFSEKNLSMHSNHVHPIAEANILTVFKTFVYSGNDDVLSTVTLDCEVYFPFSQSRNQCHSKKENP